MMRGTLLAHELGSQQGGLAACCNVAMLQEPQFLYLFVNNWDKRERWVHHVMCGSHPPLRSGIAPSNQTVEYLIESDS
jgi:hypothetical protein